MSARAGGTVAPTRMSARAGGIFTEFFLLSYYLIFIVALVAMVKNKNSYSTQDGDPQNSTYVRFLMILKKLCFDIRGRYGQSHTNSVPNPLRHRIRSAKTTILPKSHEILVGT